MKRKITLLTFLLCSLISWAQIPSGYYSTATGTGLTLKTNLKKIIDNVSDGIPSEHLHADQGYAALWTLFTHSAFRDNYYENDGSLLDIYSENPSGADPYNYTATTQQCGSYSGEGDCYNREHLIPQSYFDGYAVNPMKKSSGSQTLWNNLSISTRVKMKLSSPSTISRTLLVSLKN